MPDDQIHAGSTEQLQALELALARFAAAALETLYVAGRAGQEAVQRLEAEAQMHAAHAHFQQETANREAAAGSEAAGSYQRQADNSRTAAAGAQAEAYRIGEAVSRCLGQAGAMRHQAEHQVPKARAFLRRRVQALDEYFAGGADLPEGGGRA